MYSLIGVGVVVFGCEAAHEVTVVSVHHLLHVLEGGQVGAAGRGRGADALRLDLGHVCVEWRGSVVVGAPLSRLWGLRGAFAFRPSFTCNTHAHRSS
jgi:hypothetical protein